MRRSQSDRPSNDNWASSSRPCSTPCRRASMAAAVVPRGVAPCSVGAGRPVRGSRSSASWVTMSGAARYAARNTCASRTLRACRPMTWANRGCSFLANAHRPSASDNDNRLRSTCTCNSGARRRARSTRRCTQRTRWPSSLATALIDNPSSSSSDSTTRAWSMGPTVRDGALACSKRALSVMAAEASSITTGISRRPAAAQAAKRLKPSMTS